MRTGSTGTTPILPVSLLLACTLTVLGLAMQGPAAAQEGAAPQGSEPAPQASPAPQPSPAPQATPAPGANPAAAATPEGIATQPAAAPGSAAPAAEATPEPLPRIIRVVCTDHICGNCDGKCHKNSGHVAIDKKGHCACTPTEGSALDRATRESYQRAQPQ
jgi:hypothetical protein